MSKFEQAQKLASEKRLDKELQNLEGKFCSKSDLEEMEMKLKKMESKYEKLISDLERSGRLSTMH